MRDELGPPSRLDDLRDGELPSPPTEEEQEARQDELAAALAEALGVDAAEVETALEEIRADVEAQMEERFAELREEARADLVDRLDAAVEDGTLTEADKESVLKAYDEGVLDGPGGGPFGHFHFGGGRSATDPSAATRSRRRRADPPGNHLLPRLAASRLGGGTVSYPPQLYTGDDGEASAWIRRDDEPADLTYSNGGTVDYLARGDATGGLYGLYRWNFSALSPVRTRTSTGPSRSRSTSSPGG